MFADEEQLESGLSNINAFIRDAPLDPLLCGVGGAVGGCVVGKPEADTLGGGTLSGASATLHGLGQQAASALSVKQTISYQRSLPVVDWKGSSGTWPNVMVIPYTTHLRSVSNIAGHPSRNPSLRGFCTPIAIRSGWSRRRRPRA